MAEEDRYVEFVGSLEVYNEQVFDTEFVFKLLSDETNQFVFRYSITSFLKYLRESYKLHRMDLINPDLLLGIERQQVFIDIKGGAKLPGIQEEIIPIYSNDFNLKNFKKKYYKGVFDPRYQRLKFYETNLLPMMRWR